MISWRISARVNTIEKKTHEDPIGVEKVSYQCMSFVSDYAHLFYAGAFLCSPKPVLTLTEANLQSALISLESEANKPAHLVQSVHHKFAAEMQNVIHALLQSRRSCNDKLVNSSTSRGCPKW